MFYLIKKYNSKLFDGQLMWDSDKHVPKKLKTGNNFKKARGDEGREKREGNAAN